MACSLAAGARSIGVGKSLNDVPVLRDREVKVCMELATREAVGICRWS
jgi:hypothetical protein